MRRIAAIATSNLFSAGAKPLWAPLAEMSEQTMAYDDAKDAALWKCNPTDSTLLRLSAGHAVVFFPQDAHAPGMEWNRLFRLPSLRGTPADGSDSTKIRPAASSPELLPIFLRLNCRF